MKVYLCYLTRKKGNELVKIVSTFDHAKKWQHDMNNINRKLMRLKGKYFIHLTTTKHETTKKHHLRKSRVINEYYDFIKNNPIDGSEELASAYFHDWDVNP